MGVLVIAELPSRRNRLTLLLGLLLLLIAGVVWWAALGVVDYLERPREVWAFPQLVQAIKQDEVKRFVISDDREIVETRSGVRVIVSKEKEEPIIDLLRASDISEEHLSRVEIVILPSRYFQSVAWLILCNVPIVILFLGIGGAGGLSWLQPWGNSSKS